MLKFALLGRKGSGRAYFQKLLEKEGLAVAKSYTTREQKDENDNMHHFVESVDDVNSCCDRVLETEHDGHKYFYSRAELEKADIIPIDPQNLEALCDMFPDTAFRFIEIMASNENRLTHAVVNADDKLTAEADFVAACEEENEAFVKFEDTAAQRKINITNLSHGALVNNDFTDKSDMCRWVNNVKNQLLQFTRMMTICKELQEADIIDMDKSGKYIVGSRNNEEPYVMAPALLVDDILLDKDNLYLTVTTWLQLENNSFKD